MANMALQLNVALYEIQSTYMIEHKQHEEEQYTQRW